MKIISLLDIINKTKTLARTSGNDYTLYALGNAYIIMRSDEPAPTKAVELYRAYSESLW